MLIAWNENYSIHNAKIDEQHKRLFELARKASLINNKHASIQEIRKILMEFFDYMKVHFSDEEIYMQSIGYPLLEDHKELHRYIVKELATVIIGIKNVNDMKEKINIIAQEWLLEHILYHDMLIERFRARSILDEQNGSAEAERDDIQEQNDEIEVEYSKPKTYRYVCRCPNKIHVVSEGIHNKIKYENAKFKCKNCGYPIVPATEVYSSF